jgi:hypothetical protein
MASLGVSIDPNVTPPSTGGGGGGKLHPTGDYEFEIQVSDVKPNSKGTGTVLKMEIFNTGNPDPTLKDLRIFANINLTHKSAQAQSIGQGEFSALCAAIGETGVVEDSELLHYRPFPARIVHEQAKDWKKGGALMFKDDGSPLMNAVVQRYLFEDGEAPTATQPPANKAPAQQAQQRQPPAQQQAAAPQQRAWQRKTA